MLLIRMIKSKVACSSFAIVFIILYITIVSCLERCDEVSQEDEADQKIRITIKRHLRSSRSGTQCGLTPAYDWTQYKAGTYCDDDSNLPPATTSETLLNPIQFPSLVVMTAIKGRVKRVCTAVIVSEYMVVGSYKCLTPTIEEAGSWKSRFVAGGGAFQNAQVRYGSGFCRLKTSDSIDLVIILLTDPFDFNDYVQPACMATEKPPRDGGQCYAIRNGEADGDVPAYVPAVASKKCLDIFDQKDKYSTCYIAPHNSESHYLTQGPIYCMDNCQNSTRQWVVGLENLAWFESGEEHIATASFYKMRHQLVQHLTRCRELPPKAF